MREEYFDKKTDERIIYQETMTKSWYLKLELLSIEGIFTGMLFALVFVAIILFMFYILNGLTLISAILGCVVLTLFTWFVLLLAFYHRYVTSDRFLIKYLVVDGRIIVLNVKTGVCIFHFHLSKISCIEAPYWKARYLCGKYVEWKNFGSFKRCLLISSPYEDYKQNIPKYQQRIPIGYSEEMMLKLKELFSRYGVL